MIKSLKVEQLNNKLDLEIQFNDDLNLFTGKNGSSKTTLLKLIWYINSAQLTNLLREINFLNAELETTNGTIIISRKENPKILSIKGPQIDFKVDFDSMRQLNPRTNPRARKVINDLRAISIPTIFFPTFRRIEGGFSMESEVDEALL